MGMEKRYQPPFFNVVGEDLDDDTKNFHLGWMENDLCSGEGVQR
jgi:hypothetical protein